jgi:extracellular factor (EF) 3-hydroxypalmitic acid methyl ester biosynthesis protein
MAQVINPGLDGLSSAVQDFERALHGGARQDPVLGYLEATAAVHRLLAAIRAAELGGASADAIRRKVAPARALSAASPLVGRMQAWPRGYPGDFETIEGLCGTFEATTHPLDRCCVNTPPAQQHRNKVAWQAHQLLAAALARPSARLLSVACGGSRDVAQIAPLLAGRGVALTLNDADPDALALSAHRAGPAGARVTLVQGDVFRAVLRLAGGEPFDVAVAGGLFDYLDERRATWLLRRLLALVRPGGALCFTNLTPGGPYAGWLTHLAGWELIYRDETEVRRLLAAAGAGPEDLVTAERDATGQALLVRLERAGERAG